MRKLVCTADRPGGWNFSTTSNGRHLVLNIYRFEGPKTIVRHALDGKRWRYYTYDQLQRIKALCDRLGLKCGALAPYEKT